MTRSSLFMAQSLIEIVPRIISASLVIVKEDCMQKHSSGFYIGIVVALILGFGLVTLLAFLFRTDVGGGASGVVRAIMTGPNAATLNLATYPDSHVCHADAAAQNVTWVTYCSGDNGVAEQIELPPNSLITVNIKQYDSGTPLINDYFAQVRGTTATLDGQPFSDVSQVNAISKAVTGHTFAADPGHTFTIQSEPNSPDPIFVSVPLIGVNSNAPANVNINGNMYPTPNIISFQFRTGPAGMVYLWHCYDPCGDTQYARNPPFGFSGPMWTLGYMAGMISVTNY
jgi:hypothetical protein